MISKFTFFNGMGERKDRLSESNATSSSLLSDERWICISSSRSIEAEGGGTSESLVCTSASLLSDETRTTFTSLTFFLSSIIQSEKVKIASTGLPSETRTSFSSCNPSIYSFIYSFIHSIQFINHITSLTVRLQCLPETPLCSP